MNDTLRPIKMDRKDNKRSTFWYLGSGELPRFSREHNQTIFHSLYCGAVSEESKNDEFLVPIMSISGFFDGEPTDEQLSKYFFAREQAYINSLIKAAKEKFPTVKDKDIETYVVVRQDPLMLEDKSVYEEVSIFICVNKRLKTQKKYDLYELSKTYDIVASWEKDFRDIADGKKDPARIKWSRRADIVGGVKHRVAQMINDLYDGADKKRKVAK